jgi:tRNA(Ile)-lysidine synthetase-like protein
MDVLSALERAATTGLIPRETSVLLAVSGGADSMALLFGAHEVSARTGWKLVVAHVNHGWRGVDADRDLVFVGEHARRLGVPFLAKRRDARGAAKQLGLSPEAAARTVRYEALLEAARESGAERIATAHQQDDAIESHLIARERKGSLASLAGPREARSDGVVRPLLTVSRSSILAFLARRGIGFRRDATNGDLSLTRNRVRRDLSHWDAAWRQRLAAEVRRLRDLRRQLDEVLETRIVPTFRDLPPDARTADAALLSTSIEELRRMALDRLASPFARPGRPPLTGPSREQLVRLLAGHRDFRFEAGRRILFERRGSTLTVRPRPPAPARPVYDDERYDDHRMPPRMISEGAVRGSGVPSKAL